MKVETAAQVWADQIKPFSSADHPGTRLRQLHRLSILPSGQRLSATDVQSLRILRTWYVFDY